MISILQTSAKQKSADMFSFHSDQIKPATSDEGDHYRIVVRPEEQCSLFQTENVGKSNSLQRLAGKQAGGKWITQAWLVSKRAAHVEGKRLVADNKAVGDLIQKLGMEPIQEKGNVFATKRRAKRTTEEGQASS